MNTEVTKGCISGRMKAAREMAGLSQGQAAKLLGLHRPSVSEAEAGRRKVSAEELAEMARIYGVTVGWLACAEGETSDPRVQLAARELSKLKAEDLERLMKIIEAIRGRGDSKPDDNP